MGKYSPIILNLGIIWENIPILFSTLGILWENIPILFSTLGIIWENIPILFSSLGITWENIPMIFTMLGLGRKQHFFPPKNPIITSKESKPSQTYPKCGIPSLSFFPIIGNFPMQFPTGNFEKVPVF